MRRAALVLATAALAVTSAPLTAVAAPSTSARGAYLIEPESGTVLSAKHAFKPRSIASTTKLMTAYVTLKEVSLNDRFTAINYQGDPIETKAGLRPGKRISVRDLLEAMLLPSANDAAATLAVGVAGSTRRFVRMMNVQARKLGLRNTHYTNPIGLDVPSGNRSSPRDLATLAGVLNENRFFRRTVAKSSARINIGGSYKTVENHNNLVNYPYVNGVKTGYTENAGYCLVGSAQRNGVRVVSVVLGDPSDAARDDDSLRLLRFGLAQFKRDIPVHKGRTYATAKVKWFAGRKVRLVAANSLAFTVRKGTKPKLKITAKRELEGPIRAGTRAGTATVVYRGKVVARVPLLTATAVPEASPIQKAWSLGWPIWIAIATLLLLLCGTLAAALTRRRRRNERTAERDRERIARRQLVAQPHDTKST